MTNDAIRREMRIRQLARLAVRAVERNPELRVHRVYQPDEASMIRALRIFLGEEETSWPSVGKTDGQPTKERS